MATPCLMSDIARGGKLSVYVAQGKIIVFHQNQYNLKKCVFKLFLQDMLICDTGFKILFKGQ